VVETMHRDRPARILRSAAGTTADGGRTERRVEVHVYTPTEWVAMAREAVSCEVEAFGGPEREPVSVEDRLWLLARAR
jgi:hypothetical protein